MRRLAAILLLVAGCKSETSAPPTAPAPVPARSAAIRKPSIPPKVKRDPAKLPPSAAHLPDVAAAWATAEAKPSTATWNAAAEAFERDLETCVEQCAETAYAIVLARKNALGTEPPPAPADGDDPVPMPAQLTTVVEALDQYVALADPADPDVAGAKFVAASANWKYRQPDAIARLEAILRDHRDSDVAEYAANQLLDLLTRIGPTEKLVYWVDQLLADPAFLAQFPDVKATLDAIHAHTG